MTWSCLWALLFVVALGADLGPIDQSSNVVTVNGTSCWVQEKGECAEPCFWCETGTCVESIHVCVTPILRGPSNETLALVESCSIIFLVACATIVGCALLLSIVYTFWAYYWSRRHFFECINKNTMAGIATNDGFRRIVNREVTAPRIHRRYKKRPPVVESDIKGDPCAFAWGDVLACFSKNDWEHVPCYSFLQTYHDCRSTNGDFKDRQSQVVRHRHQVRTLIAMQQQSIRNSQGIKK